MNVGNVCRRNVITVRSGDELVAAARLMREKHVGYLVVIEADQADGLQRPVGVLTDRDMVVTVMARETDPRALRVGDVMAQEPITVNTTEAVEKAVHVMRRIGVRRLPVVGSRGELVGILSLDDVLDLLAGELQNLAGSIRNEQVIEGTLRP